MDGTAAHESTLRRAVLFVPRLVGRFWVSLCVLLAPAVATALARWSLGDDPTTAAIRRLGYGWPTTFEDGRVWTLLTGMFVAQSLAISVLPSFSFLGVVLLEHRARHWRTIVAFLGGQILGVVLALLVTWPLRGGDGALAREMTATVDFGFSVGGFCALGMWTGYLQPSWRWPLRVGISCYLACQLLFSALIYDVSHPIGWALGIVGGARLMRPAQPARRPWRGAVDLARVAVATVLGLAVGTWAAWGAGGIGGLFGWGP